MILKETLRNIVKLQRNELNFTNTYIDRQLYNRIDFNSSHIIILSGIRRCGKSTLLLQIMKNQNSFYYFNFEDPRAVNFELGDFEKLDAIFHEEFGENNTYFFDEIQNIPEWERFVRRLQDNGKKVFITGSNASLLSKELGTKLTGRHLTYELFPFSFYEMLNFSSSDPTIEAFTKYSQDGGFPEYLKFHNIEILHQLFRDIISRDIVARYLIREQRKMLELAIYLVTNSGNEFSYNRLKNLFQLGSVNTAISYISHLEDSYLLFTVPKFDYSYSKQRSHAKKIYSIDSGLIKANTASFTFDQGRILETIVFLELKRQNKNIYYFKNNFECDFLIKENNKISRVYQVCYQLTDENVQRELSGLEHAMKRTEAKEGFILTFDQEDEINGIPVIPVWRWCPGNVTE